MIATRWGTPSPEIEHSNPVDAAYLWPAAIDQFAGVDFSRQMSKSDFNVLKSVPEEVVKAGFAEILGEPDVPQGLGR